MSLPKDILLKIAQEAHLIWVKEHPWPKLNNTKSVGVSKG
jgi:hypothetical protein